MGRCTEPRLFSLWVPREVMVGEVESWLSWLEHNRGRAVRTAAKYRQALERLAEFLVPLDRELLTATREDLERFTGLWAHQELKLTPRARRPVVAAVRGFYAWAAARGIVTQNPAEILEYPKTGRRLPRAMSLDSAERLLMQCDLGTFLGVRDAAMIGLLIGCGPRISGLCGLNQEDLLWTNDNGRERLLVRFREKGDKERLLPAPQETGLLIHAYLGHHDLDNIDRSLSSGERVLFVSTSNHLVPPQDYHGEARRITPRGFFGRLRAYGKAAGIPAEQLHPHALRHLFGTEMAEDDVNLLVHQELMGHEDPKTTKIYTALAMRKKAEAIDRASPIRKIKTPVSSLARHLEQQAKPRASSPPPLPRTHLGGTPRDGSTE